MLDNHARRTQTMRLDSFRFRSARAALLIGALAAAALWGCGKDNVAAPKRVPLTLEAQGVGPAGQRYSAAAALSGALAQDTIPVTFTRALITVRDVRFVLPDGEDDADTLGLGDSDSTDADGGSEGGQVRFHGPFVIDLLAGDAQSLGTQMVPA